MKNRIIIVKGASVTVATRNEQDYISLTDMVKNFGDEIILYNWLRNRNTIQFLGIWEQLYNAGFKPIEFDRFKSQAGLNSFPCLPRSGLRPLAPLVCMPSPGGAAAPSPIVILPLSLVRGSARNSSSI